MVTTAIGIIGVGKIAVDQHIPNIRANSAFRLAAVASRQVVDVGADVTYVPTCQALLAMNDVPAVAICTPPQVRYEIARAAILAGKHVLIEKPPAATPGELLDLARLADEKGVVLYTAWHSQYNKAVDVAADLLKTREISKLAISWKEDVRHWHPGQAWIWRAGGFGVFDPGINALSIVTKILARPLFVTHSELEFPSNCDGPIGATLTFAGPDRSVSADLTAVFDWRQTGPQTWDIDIETTDGMKLSLTGGGKKLIVNGETTVDEPSREYAEIYAHFADLLARGVSHVDDRPFQLVADAFLIGRRTAVEPFHD
jgi:D-galactose 1-dehydrogenase